MRQRPRGEGSTRSGEQLIAGLAPGRERVFFRFHRLAPRARRLDQPVDLQQALLVLGGLRDALR